MTRHIHVHINDSVNGRPIRVTQAEYDRNIKSGDFKDPKKLSEYGLMEVTNWRGRRIEILVD